MPFRFLNRLRQLSLNFFGPIQEKSTSNGSIREAGGAFAEREKSLENQYFNRKNREKIEKLKEKLEKDQEKDPQKLKEMLKKE